MTRLLAILFLFLTLSAQGAKPEPLSYAPWGKRYYVPVPERQLWSQHEVAMFSMTSPADPSRRWLRGVEFKQARVRGLAGDTNGHNYLVVAMKTGARIITPTEWAAKKKTGKSAAVPLTITLGWDDVPGAMPAGWGATDLVMMPDGGPKFWTVHATRDFQAWRTVAVTTTNRVTIGTPWPGEFYRCHWRGEGAPPEVWP